MTKRKPQRPRLERRAGSNCTGWLLRYDGGVEYVLLETGAMPLKDAKRLHAFLGKAIAYIEAQKARRK